jgi:hypothetical protein
MKSVKSVKSVKQVEVLNCDKRVGLKVEEDLSARDSLRLVHLSELEALVTAILICLHPPSPPPERRDDTHGIYDTGCDYVV